MPRAINGTSLEVTKPFLKWAGGKSQLIGNLINLIPSNFNKYIEPFIGGGALYFALSYHNSIISDSNEELIITYNEVKNNVNDVIEELKCLNNTESDYYRIRSINPVDLSNSKRAARLIYLNKTCFNGLFRVNKKGEFNVPYGKRSGPFLNEENLKAASIALTNTRIIHSDYKPLLMENAKKGDFIFLDPPYKPVGEYSDFKRYTKEQFYDNDQIELAEIFKKLVKKGCHVLLTNSDHPIILDLYKSFDIRIIETRRMISSNAATRTGKDIIVIGG